MHKSVQIAGMAALPVGSLARGTIISDPLIMFDQILQLVKEHLGNSPEIAAAIPGEQTDAVHREVATHINNGLEEHALPGIIQKIVHKNSKTISTEI